MPRGIPNSGKRGRRKSSIFDLSAWQAEADLHRKRLFAPIERRIAELTSEIEKLTKLKASYGVSGNTGGRRGRPPAAASVSESESSTPAKTGRRGKRVRRSRGDVEKHAHDILNFIKSSKNGVTGGQIKAKFGKVIGTIKNYVKQYTGVDLQAAGPKTSMRYTVK
jgi:hypothetical protein